MSKIAEMHKYWIAAVEVQSEGLLFQHLCGHDSEWDDKSIQDLKDELCTDQEFGFEPERVEAFVFVPIETEDIEVVTSQNGNLSNELMERIKHAIQLKLFNGIVNTTTN